MRTGCGEQNALSPEKTGQPLLYPAAERPVTGNAATEGIQDTVPLGFVERRGREGHCRTGAIHVRLLFLARPSCGSSGGRPFPSSASMAPSLSRVMVARASALDHSAPGRGWLSRRGQPGGQPPPRSGESPPRSGRHERARPPPLSVPPPL